MKPRKVAQTKSYFVEEKEDEIRDMKSLKLELYSSLLFFIPKLKYKR